jgi:hypothetical protein
MRIKRHKIDMEGLEEHFRRWVRPTLESTVQAAKERPVNLDLLSSRSLEIAQYLSLLEPTSPELGAMLRLAARASAALFQLAASGGAPVRAPLDGDEPVLLSGRVAESTASGGAWIDGFFQAAACRDARSQAALCGVPTALLRASTTTNAEYGYLMVDALKAFAASAPEASKLILAALEATDPEGMDPRLVEYDLYIDVPLLRLLFYVNARDGEFAEALPEALRHHRQYYSRGQKRRDDPKGFMPVGLLGLAALAHDRGIPFDVQSEYLPPHLVRGDFLNA